jgi:hypothetical protein
MKRAILPIRSREICEKKGLFEGSEAGVRRGRCSGPLDPFLSRRGAVLGNPVHWFNLDVRASDDNFSKVQP